MLAHMYKNVTMKHNTFLNRNTNKNGKYRAELTSAGFSIPLASSFSPGVV